MTHESDSASDGSIAVLPLENEGGNADQRYFSDGWSEDLITTLSQLAGLNVIGRSSSFQFRGPRFAAFPQKVGLPTTTDAKALP